MNSASTHQQVTYSVSPENDGRRWNLSGSCSGRPGRSWTVWNGRRSSPRFSWSGSERVAGTLTEDATAAAVCCGRHLVLWSLVAMSLPMMRSNAASRWESDVRYWRRRDDDHVSRRLFCSAVTLNCINTGACVSTDRLVVDTKFLIHPYPYPYPYPQTPILCTRGHWIPTE